MADDTAPTTASEIEVSDFTRVAPLSALDDYEIADGYPEVRGWDVRDADDRSIGRVHDLLVDVAGLRVRYLDVELAPRFTTTEADRRVLIPVERVDLDGTGDVVALPNTRVAQVRELVPFARRGVSVPADTAEAGGHSEAGTVDSARASGESLTA